MRLEKAIGELLKEKKWTLSVAESCTGGLVSHRITNVPGSSKYFGGGVVSYNNQAKAQQLSIPLKSIEKYGPVSPQISRKMAQGVRVAFRTVLGLSTTGVAGPSGGSKKTPVGLVFIGLSHGKKAIVRGELLKGTRAQIKKEAAERGLRILHNYLVEHGSSSRK